MCLLRCAVRESGRSAAHHLSCAILAPQAVKTFMIFAPGRTRFVLLSARLKPQAILYCIGYPSLAAVADALRGGDNAG